MQIVISPAVVRKVRCHLFSYSSCSEDFTAFSCIFVPEVYLFLWMWFLTVTVSLVRSVKWAGLMWITVNKDSLIQSNGILD